MLFLKLWTPQEKWELSVTQPKSQAVLDPGETAKSYGKPSDYSVDRMCWSQLRLCWSWLSVTMFAFYMLCVQFDHLHLQVSASHPGQMRLDIY